METTEHHLCSLQPAPSGRRYVCAECGETVDKLHVPGNCGCGGVPFIFPCAHTAYVREEADNGD